MAVFCELPVVLEFIQYNTEIYYDTQSDKVAEKLYTADGDDKVGNPHRFWVLPALYCQYRYRPVSFVSHNLFSSSRTCV